MRQRADAPTRTPRRAEALKHRQADAPPQPRASAPMRQRAHALMRAPHVLYFRYNTYILNLAF
jgi:hypothetical protein